jgi:hypothetical protein
MAVNLTTHQHLKDRVLTVFRSNGNSPLELDYVVNKVTKSLNGHGSEVKNKEIVLAVLDLLDYHELVMLGDRRLTLNGHK